MAMMVYNFRQSRRLATAGRNNLRSPAETYHAGRPTGHSGSSQPIATGALPALPSDHRQPA